VYTVTHGMLVLQNEISSRVLTWYVHVMTVKVRENRDQKRRHAATCAVICHNSIGSCDITTGLVMIVWLRILFLEHMYPVTQPIM
jgi:hypothetical protein